MSRNKGGIAGILGGIRQIFGVEGYLEREDVRSFIIESPVYGEGSMGAKIDQCRSMYGLGLYLIHHEAWHVMMGLPPTLYGEGGVDACAKGVAGLPLQHAKSSRDALHVSLMHVVNNAEKLLAISPLPGVAKKDFIRIHKEGAERLSDKEVEGFYDIGRQIASQAMNEFGIPYNNLSTNTLLQLDASKWDFTSQTRAIVQEHRSQANNRVEDEMALAFYKDSRRKGRETAHLLPAPGSLWCGADTVTCLSFLADKERKSETLRP